MKKLILIFLVALTFIVTSCTKEDFYTTRYYYRYGYITQGKDNIKVPFAKYNLIYVWNNVSYHTIYTADNNGYYVLKFPEGSSQADSYFYFKNDTIHVMFDKNVSSLLVNINFN